MIDISKPLKRHDISEETMRSVFVLAKMHGKNSKDYEIVKDFVDFIFISASEIPPTDEQYEPFNMTMD